jgi:hypothetical protein
LIVRRKVHLLIAFLSLMMTLFIISAWIRSYSVNESWTIRRDIVLPTTFHSFFTTIKSSGGTLEGTFETGISQQLTWKRGFYRRLPDMDQPHITGRIGFRFASTWQTGYLPFRYTLIDIPYWSLTLLFVLLFIWWLRPRLPFLPGMCKECGYDLRATPDRCPECGSFPNSLV